MRALEGEIAQQTSPPQLGRIDQCLKQQKELPSLNESFSVDGLLVDAISGQSCFDFDRGLRVGLPFECVATDLAACGLAEEISGRSIRDRHRSIARSR